MLTFEEIKQDALGQVLNEMPLRIGDWEPEELSD
jgi:hypothetical protein